MAEPPLSILHVVRAPIGGIFRHIGDLARAQAAAGHKVGLVCDATTGGAFEADRIAELAPALHHGVTRIDMRRAVGPADAIAALLVHRLCRRLAPHVIHAHGAKGGVYGRLAALMERWRGRPVAAFYAPHGGSLHYDPASAGGRAYFAIERALERVTDGLIHVCGYEAETYRAKVGEPCCPAQVIHSGLAPAEFAEVAPDRDAADFLFIGMLRDLKGVDVFIEALAALSRRGGAPSAWIVGDGEPEDEARYRAMVETRGLSERVGFHPSMPARAAFAMARVVVVPSRAESLPYIVLETAAAGVPLIATRVGGIPEIFSGEAERLTTPGDAAALADAMGAAAAEPARLRAEARARRKRVEGTFSLAEMAAGVEAVYRGALERRRQAAEPLPQAEPAL